MKKLFDVSMLKFLLVGVGNTLLSTVLMFALEGLGFWLSTAIAYVAGAVMSFFLNKHLPEVWWERLTKLVCMGLYTVSNYFGQRFFAFRRRGSTT